MGARLRRSGNGDVLTGYAFDGVEVYFDTRRVQRNGRAVEMTAKEFDLLALLIRRRGQTLSREELLEQVWKYEHFPTTRTVDTHVLMLRKKLEENPAEPRHILSVHGEGYRFV